LRRAGRTVVDVNVRLHNGSEVQIRPIRGDDGERLRASHARLSPETRYRRFLGVKPELTTADTQYLVEIDGADHVALVATADDEIVAVARFVRLEEDPAKAEFAIVVGDSFQGQGLGSELLARLARCAAARGVRQFVATILADNLDIRRLMSTVSAGPVWERQLGSVSEVEFELAASRSVGPAMIAACAGN
jgi:GNAT superfamily N-acetyltransferase